MKVHQWHVLNFSHGHCSQAQRLSLVRIIAREQFNACPQDETYGLDQAEGSSSQQEIDHNVLMRYSESQVHFPWPGDIERAMRCAGRKGTHHKCKTCSILQHPGCSQISGMQGYLTCTPRAVILDLSGALGGSLHSGTCRPALINHTQSFMFICPPSEQLGRTGPPIWLGIASWEAKELEFKLHAVVT